MGFDFNHLLVPLDPEFHPEPAHVVTFLEQVASSGYVGCDAERIVTVFPDFASLDAWFFRGLAGNRELPMAGFTRGPRAIQWTRAENATGLGRALERSPTNLQATIWSERRPPRPPLRGLELLENGAGISMSDPRFDDEYSIAITCHLSEFARWMSHDGHPDQPSSFGEATNGVVGDAVGYCPSNLERRVAKGIGAARFWISISTGGWVSPSPSTFDAHGLELATPSLVAAAERSFGLDFGQTCVWSV